jgi:hypothetical protein
LDSNVKISDDLYGKLKEDDPLETIGENHMTSSLFSPLQTVLYYISTIPVVSSTLLIDDGFLIENDQMMLLGMLLMGILMILIYIRRFWRRLSSQNKVSTRPIGLRKKEVTISEQSTLSKPPTLVDVTANGSTTLVDTMSGTSLTLQMAHLQDELRQIQSYYERTLVMREEQIKELEA